MISVSKLTTNTNSIKTINSININNINNTINIDAGGYPVMD